MHPIVVFKLRMLWTLLGLLGLGVVMVILGLELSADLRLGRYGARKNPGPALVMVGGFVVAWAALLLAYRVATRLRLVAASRSEIRVYRISVKGGLRLYQGFAGDLSDLEMTIGIEDDHEPMPDDLQALAFGPDSLPGDKKRFWYEPELTAIEFTGSVGSILEVFDAAMVVPDIERRLDAWKSAQRHQ